MFDLCVVFLTTTKCLSTDYWCPNTTAFFPFQQNLVGGLTTWLRSSETAGENLKEMCLMVKVNRYWSWITVTEKILKQCEKNTIIYVFSYRSPIGQSWRCWGKLIASPVTEGRSGLGCISERAVERGGELDRIREDTHTAAQSRLLQGCLYGPNSPVHHVRRGDDLSAWNSGKNVQCLEISKAMLITELIYLYWPEINTMD